MGPLKWTYLHNFIQIRMKVLNQINHYWGWAGSFKLRVGMEVDKDINLFSCPFHTQEFPYFLFVMIKVKILISTKIIFHEIFNKHLSYQIKYNNQTWIELKITWKCQSLFLILIYFILSLFFLPYVQFKSYFFSSLVFLSFSFVLYV